MRVPVAFVPLVPEGLVALAPLVLALVLVTLAPLVLALVLAAFVSPNSPDVFALSIVLDSTVMTDLLAWPSDLVWLTDSLWPGTELFPLVDVGSLRLAAFEPTVALDSLPVIGALVGPLAFA